MLTTRFHPIYLFERALDMPPQPIDNRTDWQRAVDAYMDHEPLFVEAMRDNLCERSDDLAEMLAVGSSAAALTLLKKIFVKTGDCICAK